MQCLVGGGAVHVEQAEALSDEGKTVVLLHGACGDHQAWLPLMPGLAQAAWSAYAPDLPGHGKSAGPLKTEIADMARWVIALLDACGISRCALVGHSMGSLVALHAAALAPERVTHLGLAAIASPMRVAPTLLELADREPDLAVHKMALWSHMQRDRVPEDPGAVHETEALMNAVRLGWTKGNLLATDLAACDTYDKAEDMAASIRGRMEIAFILGKYDRMTAVGAASSLQQILPEAAVDVLDCGHALMRESPADMLLAVLRLLGRG